MVFEFQIRTFETQELIDITNQVFAIVQESGVQNGICMVFIPHTTAAVTINENTDPDVVDDILNEISMIVPLHDGYSHIEGNSAAHIKSSIIGVSEQVIIHGGGLALGKWQSLYYPAF